ncbi:MAG TPA: PAS domain S-box protein [Thermodesulfobacteriota bacterium]|nr:PAS domain S-box protein [Thermodesulfobacteriota bacterium]
MRDSDKTKKELIAEIQALKARLDEKGGPGDCAAHLHSMGICPCGVFDAALDAMFLIDREGNYLDVNRAGCEMFGYSKEEILGGNIRLLLFPEEVEKAFEDGKKVLKDGTYFPGYRMRKKDGGEIWVGMSVVPLNIGGKDCLLGVKRDVTAERTTSIALWREKDLAQKYLDVAGVVIVVINADQKVSLINRRGSEVIGCAEKDIVGVNWFDNFVHEKDREGARSAFRDLIGGNGVHAGYYESRVVAGDGRVRTMAWRNTVLKDENGKICATLSSGEDITERILSEEALLKAREDLEARVAERTGELERANSALETEISEREKAESVLRSMLEGTSSVLGSEFLRSLVRTLATTLDFHYAFVGELSGGGGSVRTLALWANGQFAPDFEYGLKDTPCEQVIGKETCVYPEGVAKLFPRDRLLAEMGVESYIGVPLFDAAKKPIGILVGLDDKPMDESKVKPVFSVFAQRASLEMARKKAEDERRKSEEMLKAFVDNATAVIFMKDSEGRFVLMNRWYEKTFGVKSEDLIGRTDRDIFPKEIADGLRENDRKVIEGGVPVTLEESVVEPDGVEHTYITVKFPIPGFPGSICGIATDITDRKLVEERLRESERKFRDLTENIPMGVSITAEDGTVLEANPALWKIFGCGSREEFLGHKIQDFYVDQDERQRFVELVKEHGLVKDVEVRVKRKDSTEFSGALTALSQVKDGKMQMVSIFQDITERKKTEAELLKAQKLESIGALAGGIAHDFNNILLGVLGNVTIAKNYLAEGDKVFSLLTEVEKAAERAKNLTRQLLTFSKGGEPVKEVAPIAALVKDSAAMVLRDSEVVSTFDIPPDIWMVEMDEGQMSQVINNIVLNAEQATGGKGAIEISVKNAVVTPADGLPSASGDFVLITVKDSGPGIPKKYINRVFDPFFTTKQKASGLGLAVSYSIVRKHNGFIQVSSAEGKGTVFEVYLPASCKKADSAREAGMTVSAKATGTVLVMDDEDIVRDVSGEMLALLGCKAVFANDGEEAVELYRKALKEGRPFTAVILDLTIPGGMGGVETVKRLRDIDPDVRAIVSSGYSKDPIMADFRKYGFSGVIAKPYRVNDFSKAVKAVIEEEAGA